MSLHKTGYQLSGGTRCLQLQYALSLQNGLSLCIPDDSSSRFIENISLYQTTTAHIRTVLFCIQKHGSVIRNFIIIIIIIIIINDCVIFSESVFLLLCRLVDITRINTNRCEL